MLKRLVLALPDNDRVISAVFDRIIYGANVIQVSNCGGQETIFARVCSRVRSIRIGNSSTGIMLSSMRVSWQMLDLSLEMLRVVEEAAIASARTMGMGDAEAADRAAVESMRKSMDTLPIEGTIVIGEGERDEAPMLFIGEKVGMRNGTAGAATVDIAVDPLEGTNL